MVLDIVVGDRKLFENGYLFGMPCNLPEHIEICPDNKNLALDIVSVSGN